MSALKDLIGQKFDRLTVVKRLDNYVSPKGYTKSRWLCLCDCGNKTSVSGGDLTSGKVRSCGCLHKETCKENGRGNKKYNTYDLSGEYGIGYDYNNKQFYFDLEDYDKIKNYCWIVSNDGYVKTTVHGKDTNGKDIKYTILMHRIVMDVSDNKIWVDHINGKTTRNDDRKYNLRLATPSQNQMNKCLQSNNTSGVCGVYWDNQKAKWCASIKTNGNNIHLGYFENIEDAITERKKAEEKYFGEYAYKA